MRRKTPRVLLVMVGFLVLVIILVWPVAPLWARLGLEPFCIQGEFPALRVVSCPSTEKPSTHVTPLPMPTQAAFAPIPVIVDDDGSPDGLIALLFFLRHPGYEVKAVTVSAGEAHPAVFAPQMANWLAGLGREDIPVGYGRADPLAGDNAFPEPWRQASDAFWGLSVPENSRAVEIVPAPDLIVETLLACQEPALVFVSGTHTNLAQALQLEPDLGAHIRAVYIMGGALEVPGNIHHDWPEIDNRVAEWNIWVDPTAAELVFESGLSLHLVPLDATNQVPWTRSDLQGWRQGQTVEGVFAADILAWMMDTWSVDPAYVWDLVTAISATDSRLCPEVPIALEILTAPGPEQGRVVVADLADNAWVCLAPDAAQIKARAERVLGQ